MLMLRNIRKWFGKVVETMAVVYATLIIKGKKTFTDVPAKLQEQVKQVLIDLDCGELAE
jgi:polyhydroxyalkanoate synthesis regulator protein